MMPQGRRQSTGQQQPLAAALAAQPQQEDRSVDSSGNPGRQGPAWGSPITTAPSAQSQQAPYIPPTPPMGTAPQSNARMGAPLGQVPEMGQQGHMGRPMGESPQPWQNQNQPRGYGRQQGQGMGSIPQAQPQIEPAQAQPVGDPNAATSDLAGTSYLGPMQDQGFQQAAKIPDAQPAESQSSATPQRQRQMQRGGRSYYGE